MVRTIMLGLVAGAALALAIAPSLAQSNPTQASISVSIDNFVFSPASVTVKAGTTVTWTNRDDIPHTVAAKDRTFKSKAMDTDGSFSFTFTTPGSYDYFCSLHPHMTGKIVVEAATGNASP